MNNENLTLYEGVRARSATQQGIHMPENVAAQGLAQAYANIGKPLDRLSEQFVKAEDFAGKMKAEGDMNTILMDANTEMVRRFNLPDGDDESFYNVDGSVRQGAIKDFMNGYMKGLGELHKLPTLPESQEEIQRRAMHYGQGVANQLVNQAMEAGRKKQVTNLQYRIKTQEAMGDYAGVRDSYEKGKNLGFFTEAEAVYGQTMADKGEAKLDIDTKASNNDIDGLWDDWNSGKYEDDPVLRNYLYETLRKCSKPSSTVKVGKDGKPTVKNHCPRGLTEELKAVYDQYNGDFRTEDAKNAARGALQDYAYGVIGTEWTPEKEARIKSVFKEFGASDAYANDIIGQIKGQVVDPEKFQPKTAIGVIPGWQFFRPENRGKTAQFQKDYDTATYQLDQLKKRAAEGEDVEEEEANIKAKANDAKNRLATWKRYEQETIKEAEMAIIPEYNARVIGKDLTYSDQVAVFESCVRDYIASKGQTPDVGSWSSIQGMRKQSGAYAASLREVYSEQQAKADKVEASIRRADAKRAAEEGEPAAGEMPQEPLDMEVDRENSASNNLPENSTKPIVYVPKGNPWAGKVVKVVFNVPGENTITASNALVKEADVEKLTLSRRLRSNLMMLDIYMNVARFENGTLTFDRDDEGLAPPISLFPEEAVPMSDNY